MRTIFIILLFIFIGFSGKTQSTPEDFLKKAPALPKDSCGISREAMESFKQNVAGLIEEVESEISLLENKIEAGGTSNEDRAKETALKQMAQQYGMSEEDIAKVKDSKNLSSADKQALANKMMVQQTNMSMDEIKNLSKMDEAGKKAYAEAYATEMMANAQANPKPQPVNNSAKTMQQLMAEQQAATSKIMASSQKIGNLYASIENDPSRHEMLKKIENWHNKLMSMTGIDYGQGKQMDSLSVLIKNEQIKYCSKFSPKYRAAVRQHFSIVKATLPDYRQLGDITAEVIKLQYGIVTPPESTETGILQAVKGYLTALENAFRFNLYFPEDDQ
jgi:ribonuclease HII